jgi:hypothetical protein
MSCWVGKSEFGFGFRHSRAFDRRIAKASFHPSSEVRGTGSCALEKFFPIGLRNCGAKP